VARDRNKPHDLTCLKDYVDDEDDDDDDDNDKDDASCGGNGNA